MHGKCAPMGACARAHSRRSRDSARCRKQLWGARRRHLPSCRLPPPPPVHAQTQQQQALCTAAAAAPHPSSPPSAKSQQCRGGGGPFPPWVPALPAGMLRTCQGLGSHQSPAPMLPQPPASGHRSPPCSRGDVGGFFALPEQTLSWFDGETEAQRRGARFAWCGCSPARPQLITHLAGEALGTAPRAGRASGWPA